MDGTWIVNDAYPHCQTYSYSLPCLQSPPPINPTSPPLPPSLPTTQSVTDAQYMLKWQAVFSLLVAPLLSYPLLTPTFPALLSLLQYIPYSFGLLHPYHIPLVLNDCNIWAHDLNRASTLHTLQTIWAWLKFGGLDMLLSFGTLKNMPLMLKCQ